MTYTIHVRVVDDRDLRLVYTADHGACTAFEVQAALDNAATHAAVAVANDEPDEPQGAA